MRKRKLGKKTEEPSRILFRPAPLRKKLLAWYDRNRRDLPWRKTFDPYRIWISEVMLQQTRVEAVVPYYERFLRHFPDVAALANAPEQKLLACWSGLGYYSRARNLQRTARILVELHGAEFPAELTAALALPGIGTYTASAILSIAYGKPFAVVDGNVARVLSRLFAMPVDLKSVAGKEQLSEVAGRLLYEERPGDFNQAMMELGATVCLPRQPRCAACPIQRDCIAFSRRRVNHYPPLRAKPKPILHQLSAAIVKNSRQHYLVVQRPSRAKWMAGFWEFPMWNERIETAPTGILAEEHLGTVRHSITENRLRIDVYRGALRERQKLPKGRWVARGELSTLPITTISRKALALVDAARVDAR